MQYPITDLHCDLLLYLQHDPTRTAYDQRARCSIPQMRNGRIKVQVMALFAETEKGSSALGIKQADVFKVLPHYYPNDFELVQTSEAINQVFHSNKIGIMAAVENASLFAEESDPFDKVVDGIYGIIGRVGRPLYVGLTWNSENRFGGGSHAKIGLKEDGKRLLDWIQGRKIAIDFSHASDALIQDTLNYIEQKKLDLPVMASHSNFRSVSNLPRNLPDELAQEILQRNGILGINFVRSFLGEGGDRAMIAQLERALDLGAEGQICFGADFFFDGDLPKSSQLNAGPQGWFYPEFADSSCYPQIMSLWRNELFLNDQSLENIAYRNLLKFIARL